MIKKSYESQREYLTSDGSSKGSKKDFGWPGLDIVLILKPVIVIGRMR